MASFGDNVRARMHERGLTPNALASRASLSRSQIDKWLGSENPELATIFRVAKLLETSAESLLRHIDAEYDAMLSQCPVPERLATIWHDAVQRQPVAAMSAFQLLSALAHPESPARPASEPETSPDPNPEGS